MTAILPRSPAPPAARLSRALAALDLLAPLRRLRSIAYPLFGVALVLGAISVALAGSSPVAALMLAAPASALALAALAGLAAAGATRHSVDSDLARLRRLLATDPDHLVVTDPSGRTRAAPGAGAGDDGPEPRLAGWSATPRDTVAELLAEVRREGAARREFQRGEAGLRVTVHALRPDAGGPLLWRFSTVERPGRRGLDALGLPVLTLSADGHPRFANPALMRLVDAQDHPGGTDADAFSATFSPLVDQLGPALERGEGTAEIRLPGGQSAQALIVPARDGQRDVMLLPAMGTGRSPATLSGPQDYEDIPVALVQIDAEGRIYGTNRAARQLLGLAPAEDRFLWELVEGLGRPVAEWLQDARSGRALNRPEVLRATCAGSETFVQIILRRAALDAKPGALVAVISDATELKSLEARFVQSQKMQAIGQLAGGIAHDFNNLLTAITGHCDLLLLGRDAFDPDHGDLLQIHENADRAAALVRQLLAFSRKQTLQPETVAIEHLLENVVDLLTRLLGERLTLTLRHGEGLKPIRADRRQLEQVIVNLVVNARDAMPMGGEIRIESEALALAEDRTFGRARLPAGDYALIRVIDTGVGIPAPLLDKIFEPFFTTKRPGEGTGLGLSTAYGIVKQMGGFIFAESVEGSGTTFTLYFGVESTPEHAGSSLAAAPPQHSGSGAEALLPQGFPMGKAFRRGRRAGDGVTAPGRIPARPSAAPARNSYEAANRFHAVHDDEDTEIRGIVLLVEDEAPVRAFAARALRLQGYRVLEAEDGEQALDVLSDPGLAVDIFVTDVIMPGLDGPTWVARALRSRPGVPVVFISGYIEDTLTETLGRTPHSVFLEKPFTLDAFCRAISAQIGNAMI